MNTKPDLESWPELPMEAWKDTYATLHMWTQIVGKIRLMLSPHVNHWWQVVLYVTARGLTTSPIPYRERTFELEFDFIAHTLNLRTNGGETRKLSLISQSVAGLYGEIFKTLHDTGIEVTIWNVPVEVPERIPFDEDRSHASYDPEYAGRCWRIMTQTDRILKQFRSGFIGKCSPAHFFWGAFDMAVTRFSGRPAPEHPGGVPALADFVVREAYSHEVSSCGFWPGGEAIPEPAFYAYAYPEPNGFKDAAISPEEAFYVPEMGEFVLPYEVVRKSKQPDQVLMSFLQSTYDAAANLGNWDRPALEREAETDSLSHA
jgi:hypothetical protein